VCVPYPVLWPDDGPFYGPFDRRRWPRTETTIAVEEYSSRFETIFRNDTGLVLEMHWVMMIDEDGGFSLRAEWHHMSQENIDALD
jgi:hypothetical protein